MSQWVTRIPVRLTHANGSVLIAEEVHAEGVVMIEHPGGWELKHRMIAHGWTVEEIE